MQKLRSSFIFFLVVMMSACSNISVEDYRLLEPVFLPETFFDGALTAHGVVRNRSGKVIRSFNADITARWEGQTGYLDETFVFNDGETQQRTWKLVSLGDGKYQASANDVLGSSIATAGGNAFQLNYTLLLDYRGRDLAVNVSDWMWRVSDDVVINHSVMRKFGFRIGEIHLTILRKPLK